MLYAACYLLIKLTGHDTIGASTTKYLFSGEFRSFLLFIYLIGKYINHHKTQGIQIGKLQIDNLSELILLCMHSTYIDV